jgi:hypothetical protein
MSVATQPAPSRSGRFFWALWGFDALIAATVVFFFLWGLGDGTVSSFNIMLWLGMLAAVGLVVAGSLALRNANQTAAAYVLLILLALPGLAFTLFLAAVLILQPRWN